MRPQAAIFLRALGLLLSMAPVFCEVTPHNTTPETATTMGYNTNANEMTSSTIMSLQTDTVTTKAQDMTTISTTSTKNPSPTTFMPQSDTKPTTNSPATSHSYVGTVVSLFLFFCILVSLFYFAYVWYVRHGRPSFLEIWRTVAVSARNAWAAVVEHLRPSSKEEEGDEEMEAGEEKKQDDEDNNDDDDSSEDYSSIGGSIMMEGPKYDEEEDGQNNERDDMTSIELKDEKTEREKDDLTML